MAKITFVDFEEEEIYKIHFAFRLAKRQKSNFAYMKKPTFL